MKIWFSLPTVCLPFSELSFSVFESLRKTVQAEPVFSSEELSFSSLPKTKTKSLIFSFDSSVLSEKIQIFFLGEC